MIGLPRKRADGFRMEATWRRLAHVLRNLARRDLAAFAPQWFWNCSKSGTIDQTLLKFGRQNPSTTS
jgi:hypothetical protein